MMGGLRAAHLIDRLRLLPTLRGYRPAWLRDDVVAAATLLVIAIPEQLATSRLAGMPPVTGFYAFVAGSVLFALLGTNPQLSVGADSTIAPLFAVGVSRLAPTGSAHYVDLIGILAVTVGLFVGLVWLLRLGWIAEFLSAPIIAGFLAGIGVVIIVHQLPALLGLSPPSGNTVHRLSVLAAHLGHAHLWALAVGVSVLVAVTVAERIDRRVPGALLALIASTAAVYAAGLEAHGVAVLGTFAHGAPTFGLAGLSLSSFAHVVPVAGLVALVVVTQSAATTRAFAERSGAEVDVARDLLGVGAGSVAAGLIGAFPVNASPPRTAAVAEARGRSQATGVLAAAVLLLLIPASGILRHVPLATLAGVLVFVALRLFHVRDLVSIAQFSRVELALALVTMLTVSLVGVEQGVGVAVGLAILDRTRLSAQPQLHVLGRIPGTTSWAPLSSAEGAEQLPGVLAVLFATPLWYANATHFRAQLHAALDRGIGPPRVVVLDAIGMSDIDFTGTRALTKALDELERRGITFAVARAGERVRRSLERAGLLARIGEGRLFPAVDEAVTTLSAKYVVERVGRTDEPPDGGV